MGDRRIRTWALVLLAAIPALAVLRTGISVDDSTFVRQLRKADAIPRGDASVRYFTNAPRSSRFAKRRAIEAVNIYREALPDPAARRRIGLIKYYFLNQPVAELFFPTSKHSFTSREAALWQRALIAKSRSQSEATRLAKEIRSYHLGPLEPIALLTLYRNSGDIVAARAQSARLNRMTLLATFRVAPVVVVGLALTVSGFVILWRHRRSIRKVFRRGLRAFRSDDALLSAFTIYLAVLIAGSAFMKWLSLHFSTAVYAIAAVAVPLIALTASMLVLARFSRRGAIVRIVGPNSACTTWRNVWTGISSYAAALSLALVAGGLVAAVIALLGVQPPSRFDSVAAIIRHGGTAAGVLVVAIVVVAPIVEEICFRGMLFKGLRGKVGFLWASLLSALVFAFAHRITQPQTFLQLLLLGMVFAYLRETNRSIVPCAVCHALNNCFYIAIVMLF